MESFIFVTGGVMSSLGKGIVSASLGAILEDMGFSVNIVKLDPYINLDAGTMNPYQHGEVYVTEDGVETDMDLGHYERFLNITTKGANNITAGKIYYSVIMKERKGEFLGQTVQVIPHVTDEIKSYIRASAKGVDVLIAEIGGTVGDIESLPFLEAIRQMKKESRTSYVHVTFVPLLSKTSGEFKTKPTQHSVMKLREIGIQPDIIVCRSEKFIPQDIRKKISLFCDVDEEAVISAPDVDTVYELPLIFRKEGVHKIIVKKLFGTEPVKIFPLKPWEPKLSKWEKIVSIMKKSEAESVRIAIVGKYISQEDSYISLKEAIKHGGIANELKTEITLIDSEKLEEDGVEILSNFDGVVIPGGFGSRGTEGKINAIKYCRENNISILGICLGMQLMVVEFGRNICKLERAHSVEFDTSTPYPVVDLLENQRGIDKLGGTMRLGSWKIKIKEKTKIYEIYKTTQIYERHRHRYEISPYFIDILERGGLTFSAFSYIGDLMIPESIELQSHRWFIGVQFHPEFKSKPFAPHPIFVSFIKSCYEYKNEKEKSIC